MMRQGFSATIRFLESHAFSDFYLVSYLALGPSKKIAIHIHCWDQWWHRLFSSVFPRNHLLYQFLETLSRPQVHAGSSTNKSSVPLIQLFLTTATAKHAKPIETTCFQNMFLTPAAGRFPTSSLIHPFHTSEALPCMALATTVEMTVGWLGHRRAQGVGCVQTLTMPATGCLLCLSGLETSATVPLMQGCEHCLF